MDEYTILYQFSAFCIQMSMLGVLCTHIKKMFIFQTQLAMAYNR